MLANSLHLGWLVYISCLVLAAGVNVAGDSATYPGPGTAFHSVLRLDETSIEDLNALQASGLVKSVDLVHASLASVSNHLLFNTKSKRRTFNV